MFKILFAAVREEEESSVVKKLVMGLMLGVAIGWVLLRYRHQNGAEEGWESKPHGSDEEIEITEAVMAEAEDVDEKEEAPETPPAKRSMETQPATESPRSDRLEAIKGIGPVFARRLRAAGIKTYQELANTPPDQIIEIVKAQPWQAVEPEQWIAEARNLS